MINLLPLVGKKKYQLELIRRLVIFYSIGLFIISIVFIALLFSVKTYVDIMRVAVSSSIEIFEKTPQFHSLQEIEIKVKDFNKRVQTAIGLENQITKTSQIFYDIYRQLPEGIYINSVSFDIVSQRLSLTGFSNKREDILAFKKNLESLKWVKTIVSPTSNILKESDSPFTFEISTHLKP